MQLLIRLQRQRDGEDGSGAVGSIAGFHLTAVQLHELADQRQSDAQAARGTARRRVRLREPFEHAGEKRRIDSLTVVLDGEQGLILGRAGRHFDHAAARSELDRVRDQLPCDLAEPVGITVDDRGLRGRQRELHALRARGRHRGAHRLPRRVVEQRRP